MNRLALIATAALIAGCNLYTEIDRPGAADARLDASNGIDSGDSTDVGDAPDAGGDADVVVADSGTDGGDPGCIPQTDLEFCNSAGVDCGDYTAFDNCETSRTVNCGSCEGNCGEQAANVCGCPCDIEGTCVGVGAINPDDDCLVCNPARDATDWSVKNDPTCTIFPVDETIRLDIGPTAAPDWVPLSRDARTDYLPTVEGTLTTATAEATDFDGVQTGGRSDNDLGWPGEVSSDTLWVGSFDGHQAALVAEGFVRFEGLAAGTYQVSIFASRTGNDEGNGRLTRYEIGDTSMDLDVVDNVATMVTFTDVVPEAGEIDISVRISPDGTSRFGYIGAVELLRVQ